MRRRLLLLFLTGLFAPTILYASATTIWVSQNGAGAQNGNDAADALPASYIQSSGNCGTGSTQIGAGTTIILTGNFTYAAGTNGAIVPACSGMSGNPVIITTDPGTRPVTISSPGFSYGNSSYPCCGLSLTRVNNVTVNGGVPCGTTTGGVDSSNSCGLVIEDTAEGTAYDAITADSMNDQSGLLAIDGTGIEMTGVALLNSYVHLSPWQISSVAWTGGGAGTITCSAACPVGNGKYLVIIGNSSVSSTIVLTTTANNSGGTTIAVSGGPTNGSASGGWAIDVWGGTHGQSNFHAFSISGTGSGVLLHDSVAAHGGWLIQLQPVSGGAANQIYNNQIYDYDHGIASGVCGAGTCGNGTAFPGPIIHDDHFHDSFNWDDYFNPASRRSATSAQGPNNNHHDGIHFQIDLATTGIQNYFISPVIYNNRWDGDPGVDTNSYLFLRASTTNEAVFNNVLNSSYAYTLNPFLIGDSSFTISYTTNPFMANNTVAFAGGWSGGDSCFSGSGNRSSYGTSGVTFLNNICQGQHFDWSLTTTGGVWTSAAGGLDYNLYEDVSADSGGASLNSFQANNFAYYGNTIASWQGFLASCMCSPMGTGSPYPTSQGLEAHSLLEPTATINLASNGSPNSGSPAIGAGVNLTSQCADNLTALCADIAGNSRPASGAWDIGAYQFVDGPNPPTNLTTSVQ